MNPDSEPLLNDQDKSARRLQKSTDAIDRCLRTVADTHDIGTDTLEKLNEQRDTIVRINDKLDNNINPNINKSNSVLILMFRRLRNNKFITYATILVCIAIIIMLVVLIFTKKS
jgi:t-SNARE complex subunit (syntaxin)